MNGNEYGKYGNVKTGDFAGKREARFAAQREIPKNARDDERAPETRHPVRFRLIPRQKDETGRAVVPAIMSPLLSLPLPTVGHVTVCDAKACRTRDNIIVIKRKAMRFMRQITEVRTCPQKIPKP